MNVVSNSSPLISLGKLNVLFLFGTLYGEVIITKAVYEEVVVKGFEEGCDDAVLVEKCIRDKIIGVRNIQVGKEVVGLDKRLGKGEIETIIYASRNDSDLVLMDDLLARIEARKRNLKIKGTLGVLYEAYRRTILKWDELENLIKEIISRNDIWIHKELCTNVLEKARTLSK